MYKITKEFSFCASHQLEDLPETHPCTRLHGHNYVIKVECSAEKLNETGFVVDYRDLKCIKEYIDTQLDHTHLNDYFRCNPSAENIARILFNLFVKMIPQITAIEVSETPKTNCRYEPTTD